MEVNRKRRKSEGKVPSSSCRGVAGSDPVVESDADLAAEESEVPVSGDELDGPVEQGSNKKPRLQGLYRPPTHSELQALKETQELFKSNLMKLQITELLEEVKPKKTSSSVQLEAVLHTLKKMLLVLPTSPQVNLRDGLSLLRGKVKYPLPFSLETCKGKFRFGPPAGVRVVGSYLLGTWTKPDLNVDLELSLPVDCLQVKDILNYRYFHKRALYLSVLAAYLIKKKKSLSLKKIVFEYCGENHLLPILCLVPEGKQLCKFSIRLHTSVLDHAYFKQSKLAPEHNNVRRHFLFSHGLLSEEPAESANLGPPTPHYNAALLMELGTRECHLKELFLSAQECPGSIDAAILYKVWSRQRNMNKGFGAITGFHFSMLVNALLMHKKINHLMSSYQVFRVALQHLVSTDWTEKGFHFGPCDLAPFHSAYEVVFVDSSGLLNLCADVSKERYRWLQHEAGLALELLDDTASQGFEALFMKPVPLHHKFDVLCHLPLDCVTPHAVVSDLATQEAILLDSFSRPLPLVLSHLLPILHRGLEKRVKLISTFIQTSHLESLQWTVTKSPPDTSAGHVTLGLLLDTNYSFSILNMGPPADSAEAVEFRSFWGERSELRRFDDGAINEAVVWVGPGGTVEAKKTICHQIIRHLLHKHFAIPSDNVTSNINFLGPLLHDPSIGKKSKESILAQVHAVFTELCQDLRKLKDLPLAITSLQGTSATFRCTEMFPSLPWNGRMSSKLKAMPSKDSQMECYYPSCDSATPSHVPVHPVVCVLETSGKWPDDLQAIDKIKMAFYIHISKALLQQKGVKASPTQSHLDILKNGHVFRLLIHHHRELVLLKERLSGSEVNAAEGRQVREEAAIAHRDMVTLPILTSTLHGLHQQFPAFGGGACLCKRWVSSHLLSNHLADEAIELMVAYLFTSPAPYTTPSTDVVVFLRFLSLLHSHDWQGEPLIVNFNGELSATRLSDLCLEFAKNRPSLPPLVIITPHDLQCPPNSPLNQRSPWTTSSAPSPPVAYRLQQLAGEALNVLSGLVLNTRSVDIDTVKQVFRTPLQDFHLLIHLNRKHVPRSHQAVDAMATPSSPHVHHKYTHLPVVDFDPVQLYLKELEVTFSDFALFFYDKYGGPFIAVLWKPAISTPQSFQVGRAHCKVPVGARGKGSQVVTDIEAIVADFQIMGEGFVKNIETLDPIL